MIRQGIIRQRVIVTGLVQGVWYRQSCRREAATADVAGWVRNNSDGTVEAVLEGDVASVGRVVAWMRLGPPRSLVTSVVVYDEPPKGEQGFNVL